MDSQATVLELQDDWTVIRRVAPLTFSRKNGRRLYIVTNRKSHCHLFQKPEDRHDSHKILNTEQSAKEKRIFQCGVSTKVFSILDPTETEWEVRLLLSPSEISRLSSFCNLIGLVSTFLDPEKLSGEARVFLGEEGGAEVGSEICRSIDKFLCLSENDRVSALGPLLMGKVTKTMRESYKEISGKEAVMVAGCLTMLLAAELAATAGDFRRFDHSGEKTECLEDHEREIQRMVKAFDMEAEHFAVSHQGKRAHIIFRNPCPDNWACGGRKRVQTGETLEFGQCHKVFSISGEHYEIKLLQSLQETYDMVIAFHIAGFAEHLLMTQKWRMTLEALLKDGEKEKMVTELSHLAVKFLSADQAKEAFMKSFRKKLTKKWSNVEPFTVGAEVIDAFGLLVALMAALTVVRVTPDSNEDTHVPVNPVDVSTPSGITPDTSNGGMFEGCPSWFSETFAEGQISDQVGHSQEDRPKHSVHSNIDPDEVSTPPGVTPDTSNSSRPEGHHVGPESIGSESVEIVVVQDKIGKPNCSAPETSAAREGREGREGHGFLKSTAEAQNSDHLGHSQDDRPKTVDPDEVSTLYGVMPYTSNCSIPATHHNKPDDVSDIGEPYFPDDTPCHLENMVLRSCGPQDQPNFSSNYLKRICDCRGATPGPLASPAGVSKEITTKVGTPGTCTHGEQELHKVCDVFPKSPHLLASSTATKFPQKVISLGPEDMNLEQSRSKRSIQHEGDTTSSSCGPLSHYDNNPWETTHLAGLGAKSHQLADDGWQTVEPSHRSVEDNKFSEMLVILVVAVAAVLAMEDIPIWLVIGVVLFTILLVSKSNRLDPGWV